MDDKLSKFQIWSIGVHNRRRYVAHNGLSGQNYELSSSACSLLDDINKQGLDRALEVAIERGETEQDIRRDYTALASVGVIHAPEHLGQDAKASAPPNPLFLRFTFFDVGWVQPYLKPVAKIFASGFLFSAAIALFAVLLWLGFSSSWEIFSLEGGLFSFSALATFAIMSPFLKIFHELGHVLMATALCSRVRKFGTYIVGFFPLPFVDCSDSELLDRRVDRIKVALGGVYADFFVSFTSYMLWSLAEPGALRVIYSQVFIFSSFNSVLFNLNPLLKLDGYFILIDILNRPNLAMDAQKTSSKFFRHIVTLDAPLLWKQVSQSPMLILYGIGSFCYRVVIVATLLWQVAPRYLGLGLILAVWGALTLFVKPQLDRLLAKRPSVYGREVQQETGKGRVVMSTLSRLALFGGLIASLFIFASPNFTVTAPVSLDQEGTYLLRTEGPGEVVEVEKAKVSKARKTLITLSNEQLSLDHVTNEYRIKSEQLKKLGLEGTDPLLAEEAARRLKASLTRREQLNERISRLSYRSLPMDIVQHFEPLPDISVGDIVDAGNAYGYLMPSDGELIAVLETSAFFAAFFETENTALELFSPVVPEFKFGRAEVLSAFVKIPDEQESRQQGLSGDSDRTVSAKTEIKLRYLGSIDDLVLNDTFAKVDFGPMPLWRHVIIQARRVIFNFKEKRITVQD